MISRKVTIWTIVLVMFTAGLISLTPQAQAATTFKIGDYIRFGKYAGSPILWRVIHLDSSGDALLLSDRILTLKAFDARGGYHKNEMRKAKGSNNWQNSNIRQWLNSSTSATSGSQRINWTQNDPSKQNMYNGNNAYVSEKGFLADGNFTAVERNLLKPVSNKVLLASVDSAQKEGGSEVHLASNKLAQVVTNYDKAYYKKVSDRVFLLTVQQLKTYVYDRRAVLGENYHIAKPTSAAVKNSTYKNPVFLNPNLPWYYWLNTPSASTPEDVRFVFSSGGIGSNVAALDNSGIRPALYFKVKSAAILPGGKGTANQPYVVSATSSPPADNQSPTLPANLQVSDISGSSLTVKWSAAKDNVAVTRYELFLNGKLAGSTTGTNYSFKKLTNTSPVRIQVRAVDRAGNKSSFTSPLRSRNSIQLIGNRLFLNFKQIELNGVPIRRGGQVLIPARPVLQALGHKVTWNQDKKRLTATKPGFVLSLVVGSKTAIVNGKGTAPLSVAPTQQNGNVMLPLTFVGSQFGYQIVTK